MQTRSKSLNIIMLGSKKVAICRLLLKIALIIFLLVALSNSVNNLMYPGVGVNSYRKLGIPLRSITICPNLYKTSMPIDNFTNFQEFLAKLPSMHDYIDAKIMPDTRTSKTFVLALRDELQVKEYFGFYARDTLKDTFLIGDELNIYKCATWNIKEYFEYLSGANRIPMFYISTNLEPMINSPIYIYLHANSREVIHHDQIEWQNGFDLDLNNSRNVKSVALEVEQSLKLDRKGSPCDKNETNHQRCFADFLEANLGCNYFRMGRTNQSGCLKEANALNVSAIAFKLKRHKKACTKKACETFSWKHRIQSDTFVDSINETNVYFVMLDDEFDVKEEISLYGFSDFLADFGGYLGLLLGASILSMFDSTIKFLSKKLTRN